MNIYGITDPGKVRIQNQDAFFEWSEGDCGLILVCDGMGGAKAGNVASTMAAQSFASHLGRSHGDVRERLRNAVAAANEVVYTRAQQDPSCSGMGTTLVGAFARRDKAYLINVGDSRGYYLVNGGIRQITRDHSFVQELVDTGRITPAEAKDHPNKNLITRALGTMPNVMGDIYEVTLEAGSTLLLCSDGLSNVVADEEIAAIRRSSMNVVQLCKRLVDLALQRGAPDNVTVAVLETAANS